MALVTVLLGIWNGASSSDLSVKIALQSTKHKFDHNNVCMIMQALSLFTIVSPLKHTAELGGDRMPYK